MYKIATILFCIFSISIYAQTNEQKNYFSDAIGKNIRKYRKEAKLAAISRDEDRMQFLFDSLIDHVVANTYLDDFTVKKFSGRKKSLHDFDQPVFLITYASWCVTGVGEINALNNIVAQYHDKINFVMLFWGSKKKIKKMKRELSNKIEVLYVDEKENKNDFVIRTMKHSLGFPTTFLIDTSKKLLGVKRNFLHHYNTSYQSSYESHYDSFKSDIKVLLKE